MKAYTLFKSKQFRFCISNFDTGGLFKHASLHLKNTKLTEYNLSLMKVMVVMILGMHAKINIACFHLKYIERVTPLK